MKPPKRQCSTCKDCERFKSHDYSGPKFELVLRYFCKHHEKRIAPTQRKRCHTPRKKGAK